MHKTQDAMTLVEKFTPFSPGDSVELSVGDLSFSVESALDKLSFMTGIPDITRDAHGLNLARTLVLLLSNAVKVLESDQLAGKLPEALQLIAPTVRANPFA